MTDNMEKIEALLSDSRILATLYLHDILSISDLLNSPLSSLDLKEECISYLRDTISLAIDELETLGYSNCTISNILNSYHIGSGNNYIENDFNGVDEEAENYFSSDLVAKRYIAFEEVLKRCS